MWELLFTIISLLHSSSGFVQPKQAVLLFVGDAMQHQAQLDRAKELGNGDFDYSDCFTLIAPEIQKADYAICNLEVPLGGPPDYSGYPCFSAPDAFAESLQNAGFDLFLTANNHCLDRRDKAARRTLDTLDSLKIDHIGTYKNVLERDSLIPYIKDINGFKIGLLNYTYGTNGIVPVDGVEVALIDLNKIKKEIALSRTAGAEFIIVNMHWGIEYVLIENNIQRALTDSLINYGADMIIGSHPHVVQPFKLIKKKNENKEILVAYSLGNFISNMKTADTRGGAILWATLTRDSIGNVILDNAKYDLLFAAKPENNRNFRVIPGWLEDSIPQSQKYHWDIFKRGATKILDMHNIGVERRVFSSK